MNTRVQIPAYTDRWMMGDRFGDLVKVTKRKAGSVGVRAAIMAGHGATEIAHVKLDKSGKTIRVILDDCKVVS